MREAPTYADAVQREVIGDDPLGLASTGERLYGSVFPGFNNVVRYIRVYSAICWMAKQVALALENGAAKTDQAATALFKNAIEKVEVALVWANPEHLQLAGSSRPFPTDGRVVDFRFESFGPSQASLFTAVYYKPSLTNGLQFLEARSGETFGCLPYGEALADAFDTAVRELPSYPWLKAVNMASGSRRRVKALAPALDLLRPTAGERKAFLASFFPERLDKGATNSQRARWLSLKLMLCSVAAVCSANKAERNEELASPQEIRACMARGVATDGVSTVAAEVAQVQAWWAVLQLRQLQRLCLETLYGVVERWIAAREIDGEGQALADCAAQVAASALAFLDEAGRESVSQRENALLQFQGERHSLYEAAALWKPEKDGDWNEADLFAHIERLKDRVSLDINADGESQVVAHAYIGLVFCATEVHNLASSPEALSAMQADSDACSLLRLATLAERFKQDSVEAFLRHIVKEWVVLRHFAVVGVRSGDGKNRFRFVLGDYGLERFDKTAGFLVPGVGQDRLDHALILCEQCGLLRESDGAYKLTARGRLRLGA